MRLLKGNEIYSYLYNDYLYSFIGSDKATESSLRIVLTHIFLYQY